jgi:hypothetical protein
VHINPHIPIHIHVHPHTHTPTHTNILLILLLLTRTHTHTRIHTGQAIHGEPGLRPPQLLRLLEALPRPGFNYNPPHNHRGIRGYVPDDHIAPNRLQGVHGAAREVLILIILLLLKLLIAIILMIILLLKLLIAIILIIILLIKLLITILILLILTYDY